MNKDIIFNPQSHPNMNKWSVSVVDMGNSGTHINYNVIHNSVCDRKYFNTQEEALDDGFSAYKDYLKEDDAKRT